MQKSTNMTLNRYQSLWEVVSAHFPIFWSNIYVRLFLVVFWILPKIYVSDRTMTPVSKVKMTSAISETSMLVEVSRCRGLHGAWWPNIYVSVFWDSHPNNAYQTSMLASLGTRTQTMLAVFFHTPRLKNATNGCQPPETLSWAWPNPILKLGLLT